MHNNHIPRIDQKLKQMIYWSIYFTLAGVPLFVLKFGSLATYFPYTFPKAILFQVLVEIMAAAWIILLLRNPQFRLHLRHPVALGALIFFVFMLISQIFSNNFHISFWSTQNRMTGLFHYAHIVAWFFVLHTLVRTRGEWRRLLTITCSTAGVVAGIGIIQWFVRNFSQIESTLGNAVILATYLLVHVFLTLWRYQQSNTKNEKRLFLGMFFFLVVALLLAESRSAVLGMIAGLFLWGIFVVKQRKQLYPRNQLRRMAGWLVMLLVMFFILLAVFLHAGRFGNLFSTTIADRLQLAQIGWQALQERPIAGWGFEQFIIPFNRLRDINTHSSLTDLWDDRVHNIFLDTIVSSGIIGLFGYLLLWTSVLFAIEKYRKHIRGDQGKECELFSVVALLVAYIINGFFQPEQLTSNILIFFLFAGITCLTQDCSVPWRLVRLPTIPSLRSGIITALIALIFLSIFYIGNARPLFSDMQNVKAMRIVQTNITEGKKRFESVFSSQHPYQRDMRAHMAGVILGLPTLSGSPKNEVYDLLSYVEDQLNASLAANPDDLKTVLAAAFIQSALFRYEQKALERLDFFANRAQSLAPYSSEPYELFAVQAVFKDDFESAIEWYNKAEVYAFGFPRKTSIALAKANIFAKLGRWNEAGTEFRRLSDMSAKVDTLFLINISRGVEINPHLPEEFLSLTTRFVKGGSRVVSVLKAATIIFHGVGQHNERDKVFAQLERIDREAAKEVKEQLSF